MAPTTASREILNNKVKLPWQTHKTDFYVKFQKQISISNFHARFQCKGSHQRHDGLIPPPSHSPWYRKGAINVDPHEMLWEYEQGVIMINLLIITACYIQHVDLYTLQCRHYHLVVSHREEYPKENIEQILFQKKLLPLRLHGPLLWILSSMCTTDVIYVKY